MTKAVALLSGGLDSTLAVKMMIDQGIETVSKCDIQTLYSLMIGLPGETEEQMNRTLDFADEIRRRHPGAEVPIQPYVPLPGTVLYEEALKLGFKPPTHLEGWKNFTNDEVRNPWIKNPVRAENCQTGRY